MTTHSAKQKIGSLLEQAIGLDINTVSDSTFTRAIEHRMASLGLDDIKSYVLKLTTSADELRCLTEGVVVPETWFFRHKNSFDILVNQVLKVQQRNPDFFFRILSLPCSSGEEPYSIIMALLEAGIDPDHVYLKAVDISDRALDQARRGVYGKNSFRSEDLGFQNKFFARVDDKFILRDVVRSKVYFVRGNISDPSFTSTLGIFNVIFCRNILIYFGEKMQQQVMGHLYDLLLPGGTLFTGHAEANLFLDTRFVRSTHADSFAFHKENPACTLEAELVTRGLEAELVTRGLEAKRKEIKSLAVVETTTVDLSKKSVPAKAAIPEHFESVLLMADAGRLQEAAEACEKYLRSSGPSSRWYYLLGVIRDSLGQVEEAVSLLRKVLYLDPEHEESLFLLSLLAEQAGEHHKAEHYRRRARKIGENSSD